MTKDSSTFADTIIIGTGFAGIGMGAQLKRRGSHDFIILERDPGLGGTWRDNVYPGAACDVPSPLYSFSFRLNPDWSRMFSPGPEILAYMQAVAEDEGLLPHIRFSNPVEEATWDDEAQLWTVRTPTGVFRSRVLIGALGHLADESLPAIPGLETFAGDVFHSARWRDDVDLAGKRVGIVGSGASAIQIVPEVAKVAGELVVFQRSAPYIRPRPDRPFTEGEKRLFRRDPAEMRKLRENIFWMLENGYGARRGVPRELAENKRGALQHLESQVQDPELRTRLTPDYEIGCKRVLLSNDYYPTFLRENVTLEASALAQLDGSSALAASGTRHELDVLIFCTGFEAAEPHYAHWIRGRDGRTLAEHWSEGMEAFASTTVAGFPNLFLINGPNTGLGHNSIVYIIESQVNYVLEALDWMRERDVARIEPSDHAQKRYSDEMQERAAGTVWLSEGCKSWYLDPRSRKLTIVWPDFAHRFRQQNGAFSPDGYVVQMA